MHQMILFYEQQRAAKFSPDLSRVVTDGLLRKARGNTPVSSPPFGYRTVYRQGERAARQVPAGWVIEPAEAAIVRRVFRMYATGKESLRSLAEALNRDGIPTPSVMRGRKG